MNNAERLKHLMREHALSRSRVALLLGVARQTVNSWLAPPGAPSHRNMPGNLLRLLQLIIERDRDG